MRKLMFLSPLALSASLLGCSTDGIPTPEVQIASSKRAPLRFAKTDKAVIASGVLLGLQGQKVSVVVQVSGWAYGVCVNGDRVSAPLQNPVPIDGIGWMDPNMDQVERKIAFEVTAEASMPTSTRFGCAEGAVRILETTFTSARLTVLENAESVLDEDFFI
jgi:hypothetical protein